MTKTKSVSRGAGASLKAAFLAGTALIMLSPMLPVMVRQAAAQTSERAISVRPGPLTTALNNLAAQTGLQILFDASVAEGKTTRGVNGTLTPEQALRTVLAGTGVDARFAGSNQVTLQNGPAASGATADGTTQLEAITIYGARNASTLGATTSSVAIVNAETLAESQIRTTQDTYRRMANVLDSATVNAGFVIRGSCSSNR